ncbi:T9SS type A sorting domain-containing protein, partial [bacterium]|nr:T9SS type A sorting domain-containing protein [bacterium]
VLFPERHNGYLLPRYSDATFGVHRRAFLQGAYDIVVRKFGYETYEALAYVGQGAETPHNVTLNPKPTHTLTLEIMDLDSEEALSGHVIFHHEEWWVDTVSVDNGMFVQDWPQGMYTAEVWAEGDYIPSKFEFTIEDDDLTVRAGLVQFQHNLLDDFEGDEVPARWRSGQEGFAWGRSGMEAFSGDISLESHPGDFIPANSTGYARVGYRIPEGSQGYAIRGMHRYELEPDFDFCYVEYSFDETDWMPLDTLNGYQNYIPNRWQPFFYDLTDELVMDGNVYVRWRIETDGTDVDRGVFLDDVEFLATNELAVFEQSNELPAGFSLDSIYPNPFNPGTTVKFTVPTNAMVQVTVFDVLGREVLKVLDREVTAGSHRVTIDMSDFSSGLYFAKMQAPGFSDSRKLMLVK